VRAAHAAKWCQEAYRRRTARSVAGADGGISLEWNADQAELQQAEHVRVCPQAVWLASPLATRNFDPLLYNQRLFPSCLAFRIK
jgi:hypothetical protein